MSNFRNYSPLDHVIMGFEAIITSSRTPKNADLRPNPAKSITPDALSEGEKAKSAALMRVNHAGEVSAQALYQGQAMTARTPMVRETLLCSAREEVDHLTWCQERVTELGSHTSYLEPAWYCGSFSIGVIAGVMGDDWNLGFVAETERQVVRHLDTHLGRLPQSDHKSRVILEQMRKDEGHHASVAIEQGARELPVPVKKLMTFCSRIMTGTAYYI